MCSDIDSLINPVEGIVTSSFGKRINPALDKEEFHDGIDIGTKIGTEVFAVCDGIVTETGVSDTYGNFLKYKSDDFEVMYAHLDKIAVKKGQNVKKGQAVAFSGNSGLSTGPHLHYSLKKDGEFVNPMDYVNLKYTQDVIKEYQQRGENID